MYNIKVQNTLRLVMLRLAIENNDPNKKKISTNKCFVFGGTHPLFSAVLVCHLSFGDDLFCLVPLLASHSRAQYFYSKFWHVCDLTSWV